SKWSTVARVQRSDTRLQQLLDAMLSIGSELSLPTVLQRIVESACKLVDARYGALGVVGERGQLSELVTNGVDESTHEAVGRRPELTGILGVLVTDPKPIRLRELTEHPQARGFPPGHPEMTSFLGVPIRGRDAVGSLYLADKQTAAEFSEEDEQLAVMLAAASGVAIDNARLQGSLEHVAVLEDRERIARELHDKVIQRLFAAGMSLQTTLPMTSRPEVSERINQAVDEIDETIRDIRRTIFALESRSRRGVRVDVFARVDAARELLGFTPELRLEGPIDSVVPEATADHLLSTLYEALSNVAQHANASSVDVGVEAGEELRLRVVDDGVGLPDRVEPGSGLRNMERRALELGGSASVRRGERGGTVLDWSVPLS
ncbi:MAG TPA: GAF domain-containing sensor histidine kinase, partial [Acidimicrobiia bacterium]|nr:GAF domain-containing sensor histidine kinase [Acidimicrobiia bacterium]